MNTHQYRVWDTQEQQWARQYNGHYAFFLFPDGNLYYWERDLDPEPVEPGRYIVEFATGMCDGKGTMMYAGDIIQVYGVRRVVEFRTAWWGVISPEEYWEEYGSELTWAIPAGFGTEQDDLFKPLYRYDSPEVIGNIHEHPERIKQEQVAE